MKKSRIFMAAGSLVLAITAVFATKANKKFTTVLTAYFNGNSNFYMKAGGSAIVFLTTQNATGLHTAYGYIYTANNTNELSATLFDAQTSGKILFYK